MRIIEIIRQRLSGKPPEHRKRVALVLSGGGARGYFHIGAIEVLQERGYVITSIAGTSIGALVGGIFANGKLNELKQRILNLNRKQIIGLMDIKPGLDHLATGNRLVEFLHDFTSDVRIENLPLPFCCCASDLISGREKVFTTGSLLTAIRASISIPCFFSPIHEGDSTYVDGSVHNILPLDRVQRTEGDLLVAVNLNGSDNEPHTAYAKPNKPDNGFLAGLRKAIPLPKWQFSENYMNMAMRVTNLMLQTNTRLALGITPPDICVELPMNRFGLFDFDKGADLIRFGREEMARQLDRFESE